MSAAQLRAGTGCLCIGEITSGTSDPSGCFPFMELPGIEALPFRCPEGAELWDALRIALQELRSRRAVACILARGTGCAAALALAEQLPVDRLVLMEPIMNLSGRDMPWHPSDARLRQARKLAGFARRNLSLCVSDTLIVESDLHTDASRLGGLSAHCRVCRLKIGGKRGNKLYTIREIDVKQAISCFLRAGELPKPLAENPEMCIIYG